MSGDDFRKYAADLARVANNLGPMAAIRTVKVARGAARMAESIAPVETNRLRNAIEVVKRPDGSVAVEAKPTSHEDYYYYFQEHGTSDMAPNPYMGPAVDRYGPQLQDELEDMVDDIARDLS